MKTLHQFPSEEQAIKALIEAELKGHEERLMTLFIQQGPEALRTILKVPNDFIWAIVFDHLVFNLDVLKRCIDLFFPFFKDYVIKNGPLALRELFGIQDARYDEIFEKLLDDMVIARGLLFEHIDAHINQYLNLISENNLQQGIDLGERLRANLGLGDKKYDPLWKEVMDFILDAFTRQHLKLEQKKKTKTLLNFLQSLF